MTHRGILLATHDCNSVALHAILSSHQTFEEEGGVGDARLENVSSGVVELVAIRSPPSSFPRNR
jgi:hypothetical protein